LTPQGIVSSGGYLSLHSEIAQKSDFRLKHRLEYDPLRDQAFVETLTLCDQVFMPLRNGFEKLWQRAFRGFYKVDFIRGIITIDFPITSFYGKMRYSRIVIIPRGYVLDAKELQALWTAAFSIEKPRDGDLDSMTIAVFALKAGEELPSYRFEKMGMKSKAEFMVFVDLPAKAMARFLEILIQFFEKKLRGFLKRFEIPLHYVSYQSGFFIRTKRPKVEPRSFWKFWPSAVDYIKNVKSWWLKRALKGLMTFINELIDFYKKKVIPKLRDLLRLQSLAREMSRLGNIRFKPQEIRRMIEIVLLSIQPLKRGDQT